MKLGNAAAEGSAGNLIYFSLDLSDPEQCPAFRTALALNKKKRESKTFWIDPEMNQVLKDHADRGQQSDIINMGINLVALMNGWIGARS